MDFYLTKEGFSLLCHPLLPLWQQVINICPNSESLRNELLSCYGRMSFRARSPTQRLPPLSHIYGHTSSTSAPILHLCEAIAINLGAVVFACSLTTTKSLTLDCHHHYQHDHHCYHYSHHHYCYYRNNYNHHNHYHRIASLLLPMSMCHYKGKFGNPPTSFIIIIIIIITMVIIIIIIVVVVNSIDNITVITLSIKISIAIINISNQH